LPYATYQAEWFNPRNGEWSKAGDGIVTANNSGRITLPELPSKSDWGLKLVAVPEAH
jgi:hypothetical protein